MFGNDYEARFSLPPTPFDELKRPDEQRVTTTIVPRSLGSSSLNELNSALDALPQIDAEYSAAVCSALSAICSAFATDNNPGFA
jgi:hypothetical protein